MVWWALGWCFRGWRSGDVRGYQRLKRLHLTVGFPSHWLLTMLLPLYLLSPVTPTPPRATILTAHPSYSCKFMFRFTDDSCDLDLTSTLSATFFLAAVAKKIKWARRKKKQTKQTSKHVSVYTWKHLIGCWQSYWLVSYLLSHDVRWVTYQQDCCLQHFSRSLIKKK